MEKTGQKYHIRIPMIPTITDTSQNFLMIENLLDSLENKPYRVDLLPYNEYAASKYKFYGLEYPLLNIPKVADQRVIEDFKINMSKKGYNIYEEVL